MMYLAAHENYHSGYNYTYYGNCSNNKEKSNTAFVFYYNLAFYLYFLYKFHKYNNCRIILINDLRKKDNNYMNEFFLTLKEYITNNTLLVVLGILTSYQIFYLIIGFFSKKIYILKLR